MTIIDIHSHLASHQWLKLLKFHGGPRYEVRPLPGEKKAIFADGHVFALLHPDLFERDKRIADMDGAGVDMAIISLTTPGVLWGDEAVSLEAARISNDCLLDAVQAHPNRLRWMATLPMQYPEAAAEELRQAHGDGALGALIGANVDGDKLTDPRFATVWQELDRLALPVIIHPTLPPGAHAMTMEDYHLTAMVGLVFDTTLAIARMIYDGFFDRYPNLKVIVPHSGGTLPYLAARLDNGYRILPACSANIDRAPSEYLSQIYFDDSISRGDAAALAMGVCGANHYLHGSDYPFIPFQQSLRWCDSMEVTQRDAILGGNAQRLFRL